MLGHLVLLDSLLARRAVNEMSKAVLYEKYLNDEIQESALIVALDLIQEKSVKEEGVIYTPLSVVQRMIEIANPHPKMTILEPSCGHGAFLFELLGHMNKNFDLSGDELLHWFNSKVTAVELSASTVEELKEMLSLYFKKHFGLNVSSSAFFNIYCQDALLFESNELFDLCIGNPPYVRAKHLEREYLSFLKKTFSSCKKGTVDIYFAFIEKFSSQSKKLCFITPNSFLSSNAGKTLCSFLYDKLTLLIDFKETHVFQDAGVYACILETVLDSKTNTVLYSNQLSQPLVSVKKDSILLKTNSVEAFFPVVLSGIATLSDALFTVQREGKQFFTIWEGKVYPIEENAVVPYLKLSRLKSNDFSDISYMIYPYDENKLLISEQHLKSFFPQAFEYLCAIREVLSKRDKGKTEKYEGWYAYGRKQGLHQYKEPKVIMIPQMIGGSCVPIRLDLSPLLDSFKTIVFTSGYLIPENSVSEKLWKKLLSPEFIQYSKGHGRPWPGKITPYYSLTSKQIKSFKA